ncbi:hypothetical protein KP509_02G034000 [Ceratopteris richardii]|nr:hypothetical protein KP509_02G034000 [Ceratopteris richardii]
MQLEGMCPDFGSLVCALKACGKAGALLEGIKIHVDLNEQGLLERDHFACTTLLDMYAKCGYLGKARQVFDRLKVKSVVSWNALLAGYVEAQQAEDALKCFQKLQMEKIHPTAVTFICALRACAAIGAEDKGEEIHGQIERRGLLARDPLGNTLIHMYARCGSLRKAQKVFDKLLYRDIFSFTTLMMGYAQLGESDSVFDTFDKMLMEGVKPNPVTFLVLLTACNRAGLFIKSQTYYEAMSQKFGVCMTVKHSCCVVDLLSRIGHIENALDIMHKMKDLPDFVMWHAVHNACRKLGNMKVHEQVFQQAWCFERMNSTPNVACLTT